MEETAFLVLGGNLGDRLAYLQSAVSLLNERAGKVVLCSSVYETAAWGVENQPAYYNIAVGLLTELSPEDLLRTCLQIEQDLGRERLARWSARTIDIDLICYGNERRQSDWLTLPHPRMYERNFVLLPLAEIAPDAVEPVSGKSFRMLQAACTDVLPVTWLPAAISSISF